jgi:hypothetical protein
MRARTQRVDEDPKEKSEWKSRTLKEVQTTPGVKWRAQISTAPDGTQFAGIRKVAIKKDGTEIMTKDGLSFKYDGSTIKEEVDQICELLQALTGGRVKIQPKTEEKKIALFNTNGDRLIAVSSSSGKVAHTGNGKWKGTIKLFASAAEAAKYRDQHDLSTKDWKAKRI